VTIDGVVYIIDPGFVKVRAYRCAPASFFSSSRVNGVETGMPNTEQNRPIVCEKLRR